MLSRSVLLKPEFSSEEESDHGLKELYQALSELILFILKAKNIQAYSLVLQKFLLYGEKFAALFQTAAAVAGKAFLLRRLCWEHCASSGRAEGGAWLRSFSEE